MGLYDMMMIKDNHIAAAGGIRCGTAGHMHSIWQQQQAAAAAAAAAGGGGFRCALQRLPKMNVHVRSSSSGSGGAQHSCRCLHDPFQPLPLGWQQQQQQQE
jgi:hypothetical protein